jgi:hypothetical protein
VAEIGIPWQSSTGGRVGFYQLRSTAIVKNRKIVRGDRLRNASGSIDLSPAFGILWLISAPVVFLDFDRVLRGIRMIEGVSNSERSLLLSSV